MTTQQFLKHLFLHGSFQQIYEQTDSETDEAIKILATRGFIKIKDETDLFVTVWEINTEVTDKILYPPKPEKMCGHCRRMFWSLSTFSPYCGGFCSNDCLVQHARKCRACGISLAMEK